MLPPGVGSAHPPDSPSAVGAQPGQPGANGFSGQLAKLYEWAEEGTPELSPTLPRHGDEPEDWSMVRGKWRYQCRPINWNMVFGGADYKRRRRRKRRLRPEFERLETGRDTVILREGGRILGPTGSEAEHPRKRREIHYYPRPGKPADLPPVLSESELGQLTERERAWLDDIKAVPVAQPLDETLAASWNITPDAAKKRRQRLYRKMSLIRTHG
jgi:hypothetical protein